MSVNTTDTIDGWVSQTDGRGTLDIIWTCTLTILLCCWTSVYVNVPALTDTRWDRLRDRINLFCVSMLGPEWISVLAIGQYESARQSVKSFRAAEYTDWNMNKAFFADMGGFVLETPDSLPFPIDSKQLFYLISEGYLTYPKIDTSEIDDKNKSDGVVRFITVCQVLIFTITCLARAIQHLAITTFELTTLGFVFVMLGTSLCWWHKPKDVGRPIILKANTTIAEIRRKAGIAVDDPYERTPLDFIHCQDWYFSIFWAYFTGLLEKLHLSLFTRKIKIRPIDRIQTDNFLAPSIVTELLLGAFMILYSAIFVAGWNFSFPSRSERILWNVSSLFILGFTSLGGLYWYYCDHAYCRDRRRDQTRNMHNVKSMRQSDTSRNRFREAYATMRNVLCDNMPQGMPLQVSIPTIILAALYCLARAYILVEDVIGLRSLPSSAFSTVNWSQCLPHL